MWQRFTERARRVVFFAQDEANKLGENYVSEGHLLLGLVREPDCLAARILEGMGASLGRIRAEVERIVTRGDARVGQEMQLTDRAKRVIDLAYDEARQLNNNYIGTEHLLLGLIREGEGIAGQVLSKLGVELGKARTVLSDLRGVDGITPIAEAKIQGQHGLRGRDLLSIDDLSADEIGLIFAVALQMKGRPRKERYTPEVLKGKTLAMIFEKPSLRTRVTFEVGMTQLGGHAIYLGPSDIQLGKRESVADAAQNLERWVDVIMARTFSHDTVVQLAENANVPVINGLSDLEHPCQALADFLTIKEKKGNLKGLTLAFIGDGNNVCNSLLLLAAKMGTNMVVGCPKGYKPDAGILKVAKLDARHTGAKLSVVHNPREAATDADVIYTDIWASMGKEDEAEDRKKVFRDFQVNGELLKLAKQDAIVLHCLPAHRGEEITDEVLDGPQSVVLDEAENRLHAQKAVLAVIVES